MVRENWRNRNATELKGAEGLSWTEAFSRHLFGKPSDVGCLFGSHSCCVICALLSLFSPSSCAKTRSALCVLSRATHPFKDIALSHRVKPDASRLPPT